MGNLKHGKLKQERIRNQILFSLLNQPRKTATRHLINIFAEYYPENIIKEEIKKPFKCLSCKTVLKTRPKYSTRIPRCKNCRNLLFTIETNGVKENFKNIMGWSDVIPKYRFKMSRKSTDRLFYISWANIARQEIRKLEKEEIIKNSQDISLVNIKKLLKRESKFENIELEFLTYILTNSKMAISKVLDKPFVSYLLLFVKKEMEKRPDSFEVSERSPIVAQYCINKYKKWIEEIDLVSSLRDKLPSIIREYHQVEDEEGEVYEEIFEHSRDDIYKPETLLQLFFSKLHSKLNRILILNYYPEFKVLWSNF